MKINPKNLDRQTSFVVCEQCWATAHDVAVKTGKHQTDVYHKLLSIFPHGRDHTESESHE